MSQIFATFLSVLLLSGVTFASPTPEQEDRKIEFYNLSEDMMAMLGYDPVPFFKEAGGEALKGQEEYAAEYGGVTYLFSSHESQELFFSNPTLYEPTYGGWCAFAMSNNAYVPVDPKLFTVHGNRLHLFSSRGAKARFDADLERREQLADDFWKSETGEEPRK